MTGHKSILDELATIAGMMKGNGVAIIRPDGMDVLTSEKVEMLVTALHAFTKTEDEARDYSVTDPDMGFPDEGDVK